MTLKILIWLPGSMKHPQHVRLREIMQPLLRELSVLGIDAKLRSMLEDRFADGEGKVNIWLATDLGELPPVSGVNILWFLPSMKVMSPVALLAFDGFLSAAQEHVQFLDTWVGHLRPVQQAGWPVTFGTVTATRADAAALLEIEQPKKQSAEQGIKINDLASNADALQAYFRGFKRVHTYLPLRERMCGFVLYEELLALAAGCDVHSQTRSGLPDTLAHSMSVIGTPRPDHARPDAAAIAAYLVAQHAPERVAKRLVDLVRIAVDRKNERHDPTPEISLKTDRSLGEFHALLSDAAYILEHKALTGLADHPAWSCDCDLATPWDIAARAELNTSNLPLPWSDLSLIRSVLDGVLSGAVSPKDADIARLAKTMRFLRLFNMDLLRAPINLGGLPNIPWQGVAKASQDKQRSFLDLSRPLNGHCLYVFSKRAFGTPKTLSGLIKHDESSLDTADFMRRAGIFFHAFYLAESIAILHEIAPNLKSAPIYVTTDTPEKQRALRDSLEALRWSRYEVRIAKNIGRDIYPKLFALRQAHAQHDFVLHIHSKRSPHSKSLIDWGTNTLKQLAGSERIIDTIANAFRDDPTLGMIYPSPPEILNPAIAWTRNLRLAEIAAAAGGIRNLPDNAHLEFPVGSMFWAKPTAMAHILKVPISHDHFAPEAGQEDGTLAHALERLLGIDVLGNGYALGRVDLPSG